MDHMDYSDLRALFVNCTLKPSPEISNTEGLADLSMGIMRANGVAVDMVRAVDHDIATGIGTALRQLAPGRMDAIALRR